MSDFRRETDLLAARDVPADAFWGIHTLRAMKNFPWPSGRYTAAWSMRMAPSNWQTWSKSAAPSRKTRCSWPSAANLLKIANDQ